MAIGTPTKVGSLTGLTQVTSATLTTTAAIPAGALILVSVSRQNVNAVSGLTSVTDSGSNAYVSAKGVGDVNQNQYTELWYCKNPASGLASGGTVTVNGLNLLSSAPSWGFSVWYVTGMDTSAPLDGTPTSGTGNATTWATPTLTTTNANDLLWVVYGGNQNETAAIVGTSCVPTTGWTARDAIAYSGNGLRTSSNVVSSTVTGGKGGGTQVVGNGGAFIFAAFKAASGGGTVSSGTVNMGMNDVGGIAPAVDTSISTNAATMGNAGGGIAPVVAGNFSGIVDTGSNGSGLVATGTSIISSGPINMGGAGGGVSLPPLFTVVQSNSGSSAGVGVSSQAMTLPTGVASGNLLIASLAHSNNTPTFTPPTGWSQIVQSVPGAGNIATVMFYRVVDSTDAGSTSFTFTFGGSYTESWFIEEVASYAGWAQPGAVDKTATDSNGTVAVTAMDSGTTATTSNPDEYQIAAIGWRGANKTISGVTTGFVAELNQGSGSALSLGIYDKSSMVSGAVTVNITNSAAEFFAGLIVTFSPGGAIISSGVVDLGGAGGGLDNPGMGGGGGGLAPVIATVLVRGSAVMGTSGGGLAPAVDRSLVIMSPVDLGNAGSGLSLPGVLALLFASTSFMGEQKGGIAPVTAIQSIIAGPITLGSSGSGLIASGGVTLFSGIVIMGGGGGGLIAQGHTGDPTGHWVGLSVWMWRVNAGVGAWKSTPAVMWRTNTWKSL